MNGSENWKKTRVVIVTLKTHTRALRRCATAELAIMFP